MSNEQTERALHERYAREGGHSGRNETFLCIFEKNIFLDILDDSKNILKNRFFDQTSS